MAFRLSKAHRELKEQKERLKTSEERFQKTFALIPDMISIHDRDMNILYSNWKGFAALPEERRITGKKCYRAYRGFEEVCPDCHARKVLESGETFSSEIPLPDGRWVDLRMIPLHDGENKVEMFVEWVRDISDRKQVENELRRSEEEFRTVMNAMQDVVFTLDTEGRHTGVYGRRVSEYGVNEEIFLGKTFSQVLGAETAAVHEEAFRRAVSGEHSVYYWSSPTPESGPPPLYYQTSLSPIYGEGGGISGVVGIDRDVTDLFHAREMESCMESAPYGIFIADYSGRYLEVNPAACELAGLSREELLGMSIPDLFPPDERVQAQDHFRRLKEEGVSDGEIRIRTKMGEERWWFVASRPVSETKLIAFCSDITLQKRAEQALTLQLEENKLLLRETVHRIKNNIGSIGSLLRLQADDAKSTETKEALQETLGRVESMRGLYEKMLLSESGREIDARGYLSDIADSVIGLFSGETDVGLEKKFEPLSLRAEILFPIGLILNELLVNAMKYAFTGRKDGIIRISAVTENMHICLSVEDNGKGLPYGFRLESSEGFGLMLVEMLCDQIGAELSISSGPGARIGIVFPLLIK